MMIICCAPLLAHLYISLILYSSIASYIYIIIYSHIIIYYVILYYIIVYSSLASPTLRSATTAAECGEDLGSLVTTFAQIKKASQRAVWDPLGVSLASPWHVLGNNIFTWASLVTALRRHLRSPKQERRAIL